MLELRIGNIFTDILGEIPFNEYEQLQRKMSFRPNGFQFSTLYNRWIYKDGKQIRRMWDGWKRQIWKTRNRIYFPTGLYSIVREFLDTKNIAYRAVNCRVKPEPNISFTWSDDYTLRPYQLNEIVLPALEVQRGIIQAATGSGKTICSSGIIQGLGVSPFLFFVTSRDLLTQAKNDIESHLEQNGKPLEVGQVGGGIIDIKDVNVMTVQTAVRALGKKWDKKHKFDSDDTDDKTPIEKHRKAIISVLNDAKGVVCDEIQHWKSDTCQLVARSLKSAYYTYGVSATPYRDDGDDLLIQACFGKKFAKISASRLIKEKWLVKPQIKIVHVRGPESIYKHYQQLYKDQITENEPYNNMVANITNTYIENGRLILVLVKQINHGKTLEKAIPGSVFLSGQSSKKKREDGINKLRNKEITCIISSVIFDEGIDVRPLDTVILAGGGNSKVRAMQRIGRIMRLHPGKTTATAIDFRIHQKYLLKHSIEREKMYRTEPEFNIEEIDPGELS